MMMKELEPHEKDREYYEVEQIFGTRFTTDGRYFLLKFRDSVTLYWISADCCDRCPELIDQFKTAMGWKKMPSKRDTEFFLPMCLKKKPNRKRRIDEKTHLNGWGQAEKRRRISPAEEVSEKRVMPQRALITYVLVVAVAVVLVVCVAGTASFPHHLLARDPSRTLRAGVTPLSASADLVFASVNTISLVSIRSTFATGLCGNSTSPVTKLIYPCST